MKGLLMIWSAIIWYWDRLLRYSELSSEMKLLQLRAGVTHTKHREYQVHAFLMIFTSSVVFFAGCCSSVALRSETPLMISGGVIGCLGLLAYTINPPGAAALEFVVRFTRAMETAVGQSSGQHGRYHAPYRNVRYTINQVKKTYAIARVVSYADIFVTIVGALIGFFSDQILSLVA